MIGVIDYGMGNIRSVVKAIEHLGFDAQAVTRPDDLKKADRIILPGVGAFGAAMHNLKQMGMIETLHDQVITKTKPFLGICLGLQLLADVGYEYGEHRGLGWIHGSVKKLDVASKSLRVPHIGWNNVKVHGEPVLFKGIKANADFYFIHSYELLLEDQGDLAASVLYGGEITAAIEHDNIFAVQFHPEKSQGDGLKLLKNFLIWNGEL